MDIFDPNSFAQAALAELNNEDADLLISAFMDSTNGKIGDLNTAFQNDKTLKASQIKALSERLAIIEQNPNALRDMPQMEALTIIEAIASQPAFAAVIGAINIDLGDGYNKTLTSIVSGLVNKKAVDKTEPLYDANKKLSGYRVQFTDGTIADFTLDKVISGDGNLATYTLTSDNWYGLPAQLPFAFIYSGAIKLIDGIAKRGPGWNIMGYPTLKVDLRGTFANASPFSTDLNSDGFVGFSSANNAPVVTDSTAAVNVNTSYLNNLIANAVDAEGDVMTLSAAMIDTNGNGVSNILVLGEETAIVDADGLAIGNITVFANGSIIFTPAVDFSGTVPALTYTVIDSKAATGTGKLTFVMTA